MPALISIGRSPDGPVMLDLEACGLVIISGTTEEARGLARSAALELAVSPVADEVDVIVVGEQPLVTASLTLPRLQLVRTINEALAIVAARAGASGRALDDARLTTTFAARASNRGTDPWAPTVLILDARPTEEERERLLTLVERGGRGLGVLAIGEWPDAPWELHITEGCVDAPRLGLHGLEAVLDAQGIEPEAANATVQLFEQTLEDSATLLLEEGNAFDQVPQIDEAVPADVEPEITVHLLGPVGVDGATRPLTDLETELVAFLATRERPVDADVIQTALWPERTVSPKRWWNLVSETRKALGVDSNGEFHLPPVPKGQPLRLGPAVATDLARLEAVLRSAQHEPTAEAIVALTAAIEAVHGRPFDARRGYAWVHANGLASFAEALVTDAAHVLAALHLDVSDVTAALDATRIGLLGSPGSEILYRDRMLAHHRAGDNRAVESAMRNLLETLESTDPYSDLHPETVALYERVSGRVPTKASPR
jgi:DNA-binding SARP family transcriptional activator